MKIVHQVLVYPKNDSLTVHEMEVAWQAMRRVYMWFWVYLERTFELRQGIIHKLTTQVLPADKGGLTKTLLDEWKNRGLPLNEDTIYMCFVKGQGGYAGGYKVGTPMFSQAGLGVVSDACWLALLGKNQEVEKILGVAQGSAIASVNGQTGALAHELGHTFGLDDTNYYTWGQDYLMNGSYFWWPAVRLTDKEQKLLISSGFFTKES